MNTRLANSFLSIFRLLIAFGLICSSPYASLYLFQLAGPHNIGSSFVAHGELHVTLAHPNQDGTVDHHHGANGNDVPHEDTQVDGNGFYDAAHASQGEHPHCLHLTAPSFSAPKTFQLIARPLPVVIRTHRDFFALAPPALSSTIPPEHVPLGVLSRLECHRTTVLVI